MIDFDCPFCALASGCDAPITLCDEIVMEDSETVVFVGSHGFGRRPGHLIVIPRLHVATLMEAGPETLAATFTMAAVAGRALQAALRCPGVTLRQNNGRAGDQEIDHLHVHVLPRWPEDGLYSEPRRLLDRNARLHLADRVR
ncbi:HIT family protein [bacterium]|nr:MAG: HIT family protein [bacterium]